MNISKSEFSLIELDKKSNIKEKSRNNNNEESKEDSKENGKKFEKEDFLDLDLDKNIEFLDLIQKERSWNRNNLKSAIKETIQSK